MKLFCLLGEVEMKDGKAALSGKPEWAGFRKIAAHLDEHHFVAVFSHKAEGLQVVIEKARDGKERYALIFGGQKKNSIRNIQSKQLAMHMAHLHVVEDFTMNQLRGMLVEN